MLKAQYPFPSPSVGRQRLRDSPKGNVAKLTYLKIWFDAVGFGQGFLCKELHIPLFNTRDWIALCVHYTQPALSVFKRKKVWSVNLELYFAVTGMEMLIMRFFFFFSLLKIEELKNENALLRAQLQQHGIEMVGETPPQWSRDRKNREWHHHRSDIQPTRWKRRRDDGGVVKNHFLFSERILPWAPRWRTP